MATPLNAAKPTATRQFAAAWDRFFFTPADPRPLGLLRIAAGALALWSVGWLGTDLRGFLGAEGWLDQAMYREARPTVWIWSLWSMVPDRLLGPAWTVAMLVLLCFTLGLLSRITAVLAWLIVVSTSHRNPLILFGFDQFLTLWLFYLAVCTASGQAFSVDRWIARRRGGPARPERTVPANLGLRLLQINLAILYGAAGVAKLRGLSWWDGSAIIKMLGNAEFRPFDLTWILGSAAGVYFLNFLTHSALWLEVLYPILIWKKTIRPYVLLAVVLMHLGIAIAMGLTEFSLVMIAGNLAFVDWFNDR